LPAGFHGDLGQVLLLDERQQAQQDAALVVAIFRHQRGRGQGRQVLVGVVVVVGGQAELLEVIGALRSRRGLAHLLHGGQEQRDQDGDDRDHHQQLDEREATFA
jgi:hypothetical protein